MNVFSKACWRKPLIPLILFSAVISCGGIAYSQNDAQGPPVRSFRYRRYGDPYWGWQHYHGPTDAISNRIRAQAELVRSIGESAVAHAEAREIRADAFRKEIANSVEYVKAYWERKEIYEAEKMKRYTDPLTRERIHQSLTWERLKNHPELNGAAVINGNALNYLLDRLAGGILATNYSTVAGNSDLVAKLALSDEILSGLRVREDVPGGKGLVFQVNAGESLDISRWPYALIDDRFAPQRKKFEQARKEAVAQARTKSAVSNEAIKALLKAHDRLDRAFYKVYTREYRTRNGGRHFRQFLTGKRFLQSLAGEIGRLEVLEGKSGLDRSVRFQGGDLIALVSHMSRNGLEFAPARDGDERSYHTTFQIMRDLYLTMAEDDLESVDDLKK